MILFAALSILFKYSEQFASGKAEVKA